MTEQTLRPICSMLDQCDAWGRDLQLELMLSIKPLQPELLPLLDDVSIQLVLTGPNDASWNSTLSTSYSLLTVVHFLLDDTDVASDTSSTSSSIALRLAANEEAMRVHSDSNSRQPKPT